MTSTFDRLCDRLEALSHLERLEARGTLRIALKEGGLDAKLATPAQMAVVVEKILPDELASRGVEDCAGVCAALVTELKKFEGGTTNAESPEAIFERLGRG